MSGLIKVIIRMPSAQAVVQLFADTVRVAGQPQQRAIGGILMSKRGARVGYDLDRLAEWKRKCTIKLEGLRIMSQPHTWMKKWGGGVDTHRDNATNNDRSDKNVGTGFPCPVLTFSFCLASAHLSILYHTSSCGWWWRWCGHGFVKKEDKMMIYVTQPEVSPSHIQSIWIPRRQAMRSDI